MIIWCTFELFWVNWILYPLFTSFYLQVVLETEITNKAALRLYENLGFVRDKRLFRYYLNGVDALRLKLWLRWILNFSSVAVCTTENHHSFNKNSLKNPNKLSKKMDVISSLICNCLIYNLKHVVLFTI